MDLTAWSRNARPPASGPGLLLTEQEVDELYPFHLLTDARFTITAIGSCLRRLTGDDLLGRDIREVFQIEKTERPVAQWPSVTLVAEGLPGIRLQGTSVDQGTSTWFLVRNHALGAGEGYREAEEGRVGGLLRENADLLARVRALTTALTEQKGAAEAADRAKSTFLATMSHEIRTPMNGLLGLASLLATSELDKEQRELLDVMIQSGQALMDILNDVLDLAKVDSGQTEAERVSFSIGDLMTSVEAMFRPQASGKGLALVVECSAPVRLLGDPSRIRQILLNLVGNAIKFTEAGKVVMHASHREAAGGAAQLELTVSDTGIGIAPGAVERIFQPFLQADSSTTRRFGGTGLGLAITRRLVELFGGTITVDSRLGVGSTFRVVLPMEVAPEEPAEVVQPSPGPAALPDWTAAAYRVLLVEDNPTNQFLMMRVLERLGIRATCAGNGLEALTAWGSDSYDLILMDVEMPILDGLEATREIRRRERSRAVARVPIWALSAETSPEGIRAAMESGMDRFITKPITVDSLSKALTEVLPLPLAK